MKKHFTISLEEDLVKEAKKYAIDKGVNVSHIIGMALRKILEKEKNERD